MKYFCLLLFALSACHSHPTSKQERELEQFVSNWFRGFDEHLELDYFLTRMTDDFRIVFPDQILDSPSSFEMWYNEVNPLQNVQHKILKIEILSIQENTAQLSVRVDWSADSLKKHYSFPALQKWKLIRISKQWKIKEYTVLDASNMK